MYNKLFTKILDSSIWLESNDTRLVWITLIAAMDEDGYAHFSAVANLANRARVDVEAAKKAVEILEAPDRYSADPEHEGRRIERVPGGWMVLNAEKYKQIVSGVEGRRLHRERTARYRAKKKSDASDAGVTPCDVSVTVRDVSVTQSCSETETETYSETEIVSKNLSSAEGGMGGTPALVAPKRARRASAQITEDLIQALRENPTYEGIDIDRELGKAQTWCQVNRRVCSHRFFVNWLNRVERPLSTKPVPVPQARVGSSQGKGSESEAVPAAEMVSTWVDLADAMGANLEVLVAESVASGQLSEDDAAVILGEAK